MRKNRIKNSLTRLWGPKIIHYLPMYRRAMEERVALLQKAPSISTLDSYMNRALVSSRLTAYLSIRKHGFSD